MQKNYVGIGQGSKVGSQPVASYNNELGEVGKTVVETASNSGEAGSAQGNRQGLETPFGQISVTSAADGGASIIMENAKAELSITEAGHLSLMSTSGSGITVQATSGTVGVEGVNVILKSAGNLQIDAGADLNLNAKGNINLTNPTGGIKMTTNSMEQSVNGLYMLNVTKELAQIVGGHMRTTIAGDHRQQVTGNSFYDTEGDHKLRSTGEMVLNTKDSLNIFAEKDSSFHVSDGLLKIRVSNNMEIDVGDDLVSKATNIKEDSKEAFTVKSENLTMHAEDDAKIVSDNLSLNGETSAKLVSTIVNVDGTSTVNVKAPNVYQNAGITYLKDVYLTVVGTGTAGTGPGSPESPDSPEEAEAPQAPEKAQTVEANTIHDEISTARKAPEYPYNGKNRTNSGGSRMRNKGAGGSGGGSNPNARALSGPNTSGEGVDQGLMDTFGCAKGKFESAHPGMKVNMFSGKRPRPSNPSSKHPKGQAIDVSIIGTDGVPINNLGSTGNAYSAYEAFAYTMKECGDQLNPNGQLRWGGWFKGGVAHDAMHFDVGGGATALGGWDQGFTTPHAGIDNRAFSNPGNKIYSGPKAGAEANGGSGGRSLSGPDQSGAAGGDDRAKKILPDGSEADKEIQKNTGKKDNDIEKYG